MLLLTDRPAEAVAYQRVFGAHQPCAMVPLEQACRQPATFPVLACDIDLHNQRSRNLLEAALTHHRRDRQVPTLFLLRDGSAGASEHASTLGATEVLGPGSTREHLLFALRRCQSSVAAARSVDEQSQIQTCVTQVGRTLLQSFRSAQQGQAVSHEALERGVDVLLAIVKQAKMKQWLEVVRRYNDHTYQHCLLVAGLVAAFTTRLKLAPRTQRILLQAALVHDIGKANIPPAILNKAGALSRTELDLVRAHPTAGHKLLSRQAGFDARVLEVVRHHHEFLDGSGYPDGLRRAQLSDFVRIVTICDIYAALIERRSSRTPLPPDQARAALADMHGKLDADLLKAFDGLLGEI